MDLLEGEQKEYFETQILESEAKYPILPLSATEGYGVIELLETMYNTSLRAMGKELKELRYHYSEHSKR